MKNNLSIFYFVFMNILPEISVFKNIDSWKTTIR